MTWINENSGVIILISSLVVIVMVAIALWLLFYLKSKIAVNKLTFLGLYSIHLGKRESYAEFTIGNKSLNDVAISEIGLKNGKITFNLTSLYRDKIGVNAETKIVVEQRGSICFQLSSEELKLAVVDGKNGKRIVKALRIYAIDLAGNLHQGKVRSVTKLLRNLVAADLAKEKSNAQTFAPVAAPVATPVKKPIVPPAPVTSLTTTEAKEREEEEPLNKEEEDETFDPVL